MPRAVMLERTGAVTSELHILKAHYTIARAWRDMGLGGAPGKCVCSPLRKDDSPSFSVFGVGADQRFNDFATGEKGDVFEFIAKARRCSLADAIAFVRERMGIFRETRRPASPIRKKVSKLPALRKGTDAELRQLADSRGFSVDALAIAQQRGFLFFAKLWGYSAWCIADQRGQLHEFRRVDSDPWPPCGRLPARKCHTFGSGKSWPIGTIESLPFQRIAWVEGGPDFLAAFHFLLAEKKLQTVAPVAILGAANHQLSADAVTHFAGKSVCLYPHRDAAGRTAARAWAQQLRQVGAARVTAFDLSGLVLTDGGAGKDLADAARIGADCFEQERKFREIMP